MPSSLDPRRHWPRQRIRNPAMALMENRSIVPRIRERTARIRLPALVRLPFGAVKPGREIWRAVGASSRHEVSNFGRIRRAGDRRIVVPTLRGTGTLVVNLYADGKTNVRAAHSRLSRKPFWDRGRADIWCCTRTAIRRTAARRTFFMLLWACANRAIRMRVASTRSASSARSQPPRSNGAPERENQGANWPRSSA